MGKHATVVCISLRLFDLGASMSQLHSGLRSPPASLLALPAKLSSSNEPVSIQCMRLHRPALSWSKLDTAALCNGLALPTAFGSVYVGESLSMLLCCRNTTSHKTLYNVSFQVELQTSPTMSRFTLLDSSAVKMIPQLEPGAVAHWQIYHEVKELGSHTLLCTVQCAEGPNSTMPPRPEAPAPAAGKASSQSLAPSQLPLIAASHPLVPPVAASSFALTSRKILKSFKFSVHNPLSVKTKVSLLPHLFGGDTVLALEIQMTNLTDAPLKMEEVRFEPSLCFDCQDMNKMLSLAESSASSLSDSIFGNMALFYPKHTRQYLFVLRAKPECIGQARKAPTLGRLDVTWTSALGGYGRLQTSELQRKVPINESKLYCQVLNLPAQLYAETPFTCTLSLSLLKSAEDGAEAQEEHGLASKDMFELTLNSNHSKDMLLLGEYPKQIFDIRQHNTIECEWLPCRSGIHHISLTVKRKERTPASLLSKKTGAEPLNHLYASVVVFEVFVAASSE